MVLNNKSTIKKPSDLVNKMRQSLQLANKRVSVKEITLEVCYLMHDHTPGLVVLYVELCGLLDSCGQICRFSSYICSIFKCLHLLQTYEG